MRLSLRRALVASPLVTRCLAALTPAATPPALGMYGSHAQLSGYIQLNFAQGQARQGPGAAAHATHACFNVTLYVCDWDGNNSVLTGGGSNNRRRMGVDVLAPPTMDPAFATAVLNNEPAGEAPHGLGQGQHLTFRVCDPRLDVGVRFKFWSVFGLNSVVSAIFFD